MFELRPQDVQAEEIVHEGDLDGTLHWSIDSNGKFTLTGSGSGDYEGFAPWRDFQYEIITAELSATDMTENVVLGGCKNFVYVDASNYDTSNITDFSYMFTGCETLETVELSNWNTMKVNYMDVWRM